MSTLRSRTYLPCKPLERSALHYGKGDPSNRSTQKPTNNNIAYEMGIGNDQHDCRTTRGGKIDRSQSRIASPQHGEHSHRCGHVAGGKGIKNVTSLEPMKSILTICDERDGVVPPYFWRRPAENPLHQIIDFFSNQNAKRTREHHLPESGELSPRSSTQTQSKIGN